MDLDSDGFPHTQPASYEAAFDAFEDSRPALAEPDAAFACEAADPHLQVPQWGDAPRSHQHRREQR